MLITKDERRKNVQGNVLCWKALHMAVSGAWHFNEILPCLPTSGVCKMILWKAFLGISVQENSVQGKLTAGQSQVFNINSAFLNKLRRHYHNWKGPQTFEVSFDHFQSVCNVRGGRTLAQGHRAASSLGRQVTWLSKMFPVRSQRCRPRFASWFFFFFF